MFLGGVAIRYEGFVFTGGAGLTGVWLFTAWHFGRFLQGHLNTFLFGLTQTRRWQALACGLDFLEFGLVMYLMDTNEVLPQPGYDGTTVSNRTLIKADCFFSLFLSGKFVLNMYKGDPF